MPPSTPAAALQAKHPSPPVEAKPPTAAAEPAEGQAPLAIPSSQALPTAPPAQLADAAPEFEAQALSASAAPKTASPAAPKPAKANLAFQGWSGGSFDVRTSQLEEPKSFATLPPLADPSFFARSWNRSQPPVVQLSRDEDAIPPSEQPRKVPVEVRAGRNHWAAGWHRVGDEAANAQVSSASPPDQVAPVANTPAPAPTVVHTEPPAPRPSRKSEPRHLARPAKGEIEVPTRLHDGNLAGPRQAPRKAPELKVSIGTVKVVESAPPAPPKSHETAYVKPTKSLDEFLTGH